MNKFQVMQKCLAVFLALVACKYSPLAHGRQLRPLNNPSWNTGSVVLNNVPTPLLDKKNMNSVPMKSNFDVESLGDSGAGNPNAFRPTTPGNSPGVGHKIFTQDNSMKSNVGVHSPDVEVSMTEHGSENDFKPTNPGHSPGVGHGYQTKIGHQN